MDILKINAEFHGKFLTKPMIAFKYNKSLQDVIGRHPIKEVYKDKMENLCCLYSKYAIVYESFNNLIFNKRVMYLIDQPATVIESSL